MLDNLRSEATFQDDEPLVSDLPQRQRPRQRRGFDRLTSTTAPQRFMLAVMLFITVCLLGFMFLILAEKINLPFF